MIVATIAYTLAYVLNLELLYLPPICFISTLPYVLYLHCPPQCLQRNVPLASFTCFFVENTSDNVYRL